MLIWLCCDGLLLLATVIPLFRGEHYAVRGWDFPRLQIGCLAAVSILARMVFTDVGTGWDWLSLGLAGFALAIQTWWIFPFTVLARREVRSTVKPDRARSIRIVTANVLQPNRNVSGFHDIVRQADPDVLVVLEGDPWWEEQLDARLGEVYRHQQKCPQDNLYGMLLYSRLELAEMQTEFLVEDDVPSMHGRIRLPGGDWVRTHWLHPKPPSPTENPASGERDAELVMVGRRVAERPDEPTIVAGDLNDVAWSATTRLFRKLSGLRDPRVGRGFYSSFHAKLPGLRWPLDHLFHSADFTLNEIRCLPGYGSDHFPLLMDLQWEPQPSTDDEGLSADAADRRWAKEKMAAEDVRAADVP